MLFGLLGIWLGALAILLSGYIAGGKMHKPGMVGAANEFKNFDGRVGIRGKSIAKIGIEIGEP